MCVCVCVCFLPRLITARDLVSPTTIPSGSEHSARECKYQFQIAPQVSGQFEWFERQRKGCVSQNGANFNTTEVIFSGKRGIKNITERDLFRVELMKN